ncbi:hypothetical protein [Mesorhizobium sp. ZC-5]|uniref:hypothetical protein n=1 Tax=Mesorhizobium sp. ZC-5 TaxID=2986066 RepID=UPI0021E705A1|nr:hypothetical protein [Mesorhizobium sp. ZC-5]MCV3239678.1 hypothetical protein [Mesorhizobium sp. ZC-5]
MTNTDLQAALAAAEAEYSAISEELGEALKSGSAPATLKTKLAKARAKVEEERQAIEALEAANARAARVALDREEKAKQAELKRLLQSARDEHKAIVDRAQAADEAWEAFNRALTDLGSACDSYIEAHRPLNMDRNLLGTLKGRRWVSQVFANFKNHGDRSIRDYLNARRLLISEASGTKLGIADLIPPLNKLMMGRGE